MRNQQIQYYDPYSILVIRSSGTLVQVFVPFKAICIQPVNHLKKDTLVYIEQVAPDTHYTLIYRVIDAWFPYDCFRLI